jgi:hypothetical protein
MMHGPINIRNVGQFLCRIKSNWGYQIKKVTHCSGVAGGE